MHSWFAGKNITYVHIQLIYVMLRKITKLQISVATSYARGRREMVHHKFEDGSLASAIFSNLYFKMLLECWDKS